MYRIIFIAIFIFGAFGIFSSTPAQAIELPNYAQGGNLKTTATTKGRVITETISLIVAILAIIGIIIGAGWFGVGQPEKGKVWCLGGVVALLIGGSAYGIAAMVA